MWSDITSYWSRMGNQDVGHCCSPVSPVGVGDTGEPGGAGSAQLAAVAEDSHTFISAKCWGLHPLTTLWATLWTFWNVRKCHRERESPVATASWLTRKQHKVWYLIMRMLSFLHEPGRTCLGRLHVPLCYARRHARFLQVTCTWHTPVSLCEPEIAIIKTPDSISVSEPYTGRTHHQIRTPPTPTM